MYSDLSILQQQGCSSAKMLLHKKIHNVKLNCMQDLNIFFVLGSTTATILNLYRTSKFMELQNFILTIPDISFKIATGRHFKKPWDESKIAVFTGQNVLKNNRHVLKNNTSSSENYVIIRELHHHQRTTSSSENYVTIRELRHRQRTTTSSVNYTMIIRELRHHQRTTTSSSSLTML